MDIQKVRVENMRSPRGAEAPYQFVIHIDGAEYFQSYSSIIALKKDGKVYLDEHYWDSSTTTIKYRNEFLCENEVETQKKIDSGEYIFTNLN